MSTDRELLELAAKAAGITGFSGEDCHGAYFCTPANHDIPRSEPTIYRWLADDGDALRLAVNLGLEVFPRQGMNGDITTIAFQQELDMESLCEHHKGDAMQATRRAIVRAAAGIGSQMQWRPLQESNLQPPA